MNLAQHSTAQPSLAQLDPAQLELNSPNQTHVAIDQLAVSVWSFPPDRFDSHSELTCPSVV